MSTSVPHLSSALAPKLGPPAGPGSLRDFIGLKPFSVIPALEQGTRDETTTGNVISCPLQICW